MGIWFIISYEQQHDKINKMTCAQQRHRSAWASAQSDQSLCCALYRLVGWLCWGLTSQSTIFQSCRDGAIASWVINQYFREVKCLAQGHNTAAVGLEPRTSRSGVRHSTTEPPRSPKRFIGSQGPKVSSCRQWRLIRLGTCPVPPTQSNLSLRWRHIMLLVLSCCGSCERLEEQRIEQWTPGLQV